MKVKHRRLLEQISMRFGAFTTQSLSINLNELAEIFSPTELSFHFPPDGVISKETFDYFLEIRYQNQIVGYYKISIFDFSSEIELHAGITPIRPFLNRSYFQLTKLFVLEILQRFPAYPISLWVDQKNAKIISLLQFIGFEKSTKPLINDQYEHYFLSTKNLNNEDY
jgi:hypothetical protein